MTANAVAGSAERTQVTVGTGTSVSLLAVSGTINFASVGTAAPFVFDIQNGGIPLNVSVTRTIATSSGIQLNGANQPVGTTFVQGTNYVLTSSDFSSFSGVSLTVGTGNTLVLTFTPVPEPATILGIAAAGAFLFRLRRKVM